MKKYNLFNLQWVLMWIVVPILCFLLSANVTYAYFTATATKKESTATTGKIILEFSSATIGRAVNKISETNTTTILPGDTLNINGELKNTGTADCYAIMEVEVYVTKSGETEREYVTHKYYTFVGTSLVEITGTTGAYTSTAATITASTGKTFNLNYLFDGEQYDNSYKQATVTYILNGYAIQTANVDANEATKQLLDNAGYKYLQIYGNSYQATTPTVDNPVEIQNVGERTKNLFDLSNVSVGYNGEEISVSKQNQSLTFTYNGSKSDYFAFSYWLETKPNTNYTVQLDNNVSINQIYLYTDTLFGNRISYHWFENNSVTFNSGENEKVLIGFYTINVRRPSPNGTETLYNIQIEEGSTATEYEPYGYKIPVTVRSKNLFSAVQDNSQWHVTTEVLQTGEIKQTGTSSSDPNGYSQFKVSLKSGTYTMSASTDGNGTGSLSKCLLLWKAPNAGGGTVTSLYFNSKSSASVKFTITEDMDCWLGVYGRCNLNEVQTFKIQIEEGETATSFEKYVTPTTTQVYLDEPLRKVGNYVDCLDLQTGTVTRNVRHLELAFKDMNNNEDYPGWSTVDIIASDYPNQNTGIINVTSIASNIHNSINIGINTKSSNRIMFISGKTTTLTQTEWKTNYPDLVLKLDYGLATPEVETISVPDLGQYEGSVIEIGTTVQPSSTITQDSSAVPTEYQAVEYIQSNGTEYIDTGYTPTNKTNVIFDYDYIAPSYSGYVPICGVRISYSQMFAFWVNNTSSTYVPALNYGATDTTDIAGYSALGRHTWSNDGGNFYLDGTLFKTVEATEFNTGGTLTIFALRNSASGAETRNSIGKLYGFSIFDDGTLVRDFVPCYRKSDNVIGLYDRVTNQFFTNAGTGTFTKGADV